MSSFLHNDNNYGVKLNGRWLQRDHSILVFQLTVVNSLLFWPTRYSILLKLKYKTAIL